jgi:hypothetical protein
MSNENSAEKRHGMAWPLVIVIMVVGMAGGLALALLLIPQLSVRSAVQGGTIAFCSTLALLLLPKASRRFRQRSGRE